MFIDAYILPHKDAYLLPHKDAYLLPHKDAYLLPFIKLYSPHRKITNVLGSKFYHRW